MHSRTLSQTEPVVRTPSWIDCSHSLPVTAAETPGDSLNLDRPALDVAAGYAVDDQSVQPPGGTPHSTTQPMPVQSTGPGVDAPSSSSPATMPAKDLARFVTRVRELLDATDESTRRQLENEVLDLAATLHAAGMFEILHIAHPALATMVRDHLAESAAARQVGRGPVRLAQAGQ